MLRGAQCVSEFQEFPSRSLKAISRRLYIGIIDALNAAGALTKEFRLALLGKTKSGDGFSGPLNYPRDGQRRMTRQFTIWHNLKSEHGNCSWAVIDGRLVVKTCLGSKSMKLGANHSPEALARVMTWEIDLENAPGHTE